MNACCMRLEKHNLMYTMPESLEAPLMGSLCLPAYLAKQKLT